jgi:hypothetical protein
LSDYHASVAALPVDEAAVFAAVCREFGVDVNATGDGAPIPRQGDARATPAKHRGRLPGDTLRTAPGRVESREAHRNRGRQSLVSATGTRQRPPRPLDTKRASCAAE